MRVFAVMGLLGVVACQTKEECKPTKSKDEWLCTPGNNVFCRCEDLSAGTKKCGCDAESFAECVCPSSGKNNQSINEHDPDEPVRGGSGVTGPTNDVMTPVGMADTCPGAPLAADAGRVTVVRGDTSTANADDVSPAGACAVATGNENVYEVIPTATGKLTITVRGSADFDPTIYAREEDCAAGAQRACGETTGPGEDEVIRFNVIVGHKYYVFADGKTNSSGAYTLEASIETGSFCGDQSVDTGESCDDGNKVSNDGCGNDCRPEGNPASGATCPGQVVHVWKGTSVQFAGSTATYSPRAVATGCPESDGADRVFAVVAHGGGTMTATLDADFDGLVYARDASCEGDEIVCIDRYTNAPEVAEIPVTDGNTYWLFVDGANAADSGAFTLKLALP